MYILFYTRLSISSFSTHNQFLLSSYKFIHFINTTMDNSPYTCYHAQIQCVCRNIRRNIDHALDNNPPTLPPDDGSFMIKVLRYKLDRATGQLFYIINTPSQKFPVPIIHLTGSHGNLYKITFTPPKIS